ncbi:MAG: xanthine dehydrogenase family protein molybdopterin-binding subunit [Betaproteobacteria bacterium]|nr:xanthine dehydrogenase family protein molybdopterin-binding subunit [Betaproteobacteria bacterium]
MNNFAIGQSVPRVEDARFITGRGRYIGDVNLPDQAHAAVLRSPHAAAAIRSIDTGPARAAPGVLGVFSAKDLGNELGTTSISFKRRRPDGSPMFWRAHPGLATDRVRYVGDPVALVVAETLEQARDAAELIEVDYDAGAAVADILSALDPGSPAVWDECPDNISNIHEMGDRAATEAAFTRARHVVKRRYVVSRVHSQYMEPRSALAVHDPREDCYTLYCDVQAPHALRDLLALEVLRIPKDRIRVVAFDIGGAFGGKGPAVEHRLILWAAKRLGRPVKWQASRSEALLADEHGRDNAHEAELALDADGKFLALRSHWIANVGAYINGDRNFQCSFTNTPGIVGVYAFPTAYVRSTCVMTNTGMLAPYRGAGRPEATFVIERLIDDAAAELGLDRIELRRKNVIPPEALPLNTALGFVYDCGNFGKCMDRALEMADWTGFDARREGSKSKGLLRGIGLANPIERAGPVSTEYAEIRLDGAGKATVLMGTKNQGQGHETTFKQVLYAKLGIAPENVDYIDGDTNLVAQGIGTFGSRSASIGGSALVVASNKVIEKGRKIAAHLMEAAEADIVFKAGHFSIEGTDRRRSLDEIAQAASQPGKIPPGMEPGLFGSGAWSPPDVTFPYGTHVCEVEVDPETGVVRVVRYFVVDDVGTMINPAILKGQIHGGIAQGAGQVLMEQVAYDRDSGQLLSGSFLDYAMPRADDFCNIEFDSLSVPTERNLLGVKGAGEAGAVGALPVVMNAIMDALAPLGVKELDMPATPDRVWRAIRGARK